MKNQLVVSLIVAEIVGVVLGTDAQNITRPNILFCIADDASYHHFSSNGCCWIETPAFDRVANEGIRFSRTYTPNAKSGPSRSCILTGRNSWQLKEAGNHISNFPAEFKVFTEVLAENGYIVAYTGKGWAPGNPGMKNGKQRLLTGKVYNTKKCVPLTDGISTTDYVNNFIDFLNENKNAARPWFFWFGSHEPHRSYEWQSGLKVGKKLEMIDRIQAYYPDCDSVRTDLLDYGLEIEYFDSNVGRMIAELEKRGLLDDTLIVITSDNGMPFPRSKANNYEYSNHMPCAIMWPNGIKNSGRSYDGYISFVDFAPTFLELCNINPDNCGMQSMTGVSFCDILADNELLRLAEFRKNIIMGRERDDYGRPKNQGYPIRAIIRDDMLYIMNLKPWLCPAGNGITGYLDVDGSPTKSVILNMYRKGNGGLFYELSFGLRQVEELYDLTKDSDCVNNLAGLPTYWNVKCSLRDELIETLLMQDDPRMSVGGDAFDMYPFDTPNKANFYERVYNGEIKEPWKQTNWVNATDYESYLSR